MSSPATVIHHQTILLISWVVYLSFTAKRARRFQATLEGGASPGRWGHGSCRGLPETHADRRGRLDGENVQGWAFFGGTKAALPAYALLEAGVPANDPVIQKAVEYLRPKVITTDFTYEISLAILFFDRLNDPRDKKLIQTLALR